MEFAALAELIQSFGPLSGLFRGRTQHLPFDRANVAAREYAQQVFNILARLYGSTPVGANGSISIALRARLLALGPGARWSWPSSVQYADMTTRQNLNVYQLLELYYTYILQVFDVARVDELQRVMVADLDLIRNAIQIAGFDVSDFSDGLQVVNSELGITLTSNRATANQLLGIGKYVIAGVAIIAVVGYVAQQISGKKKK